MGKTLNARGKFGRQKAGDRSKHWKHGKSSGKNDQERKARKLAKRGK